MKTLTKGIAAGALALALAFGGATGALAKSGVPAAAHHNHAGPGHGKARASHGIPAAHHNHAGPGHGK